MKTKLCVYDYDDENIITSCGSKIPIEVFMDIGFCYCPRCGKPITGTMDFRRELNRQRELMWIANGKKRYNLSTNNLSIN